MIPNGMAAYDSAAKFFAPGIMKLRYLGYAGDWRAYTHDEQAKDRSLGCVSVMIRETNGHMNGYSHGLADGKDAITLMSYLGRDTHTEAVVFTIDHGPPYTVQNINDYMIGVLDSGCKIPIFYGPNNIGDSLYVAGRSRGTWVAGAFSWGTDYQGSNHPPRCASAVGWQYPRYVSVGGVTCDYNEFYTDLSWIHNGASTPIYVPTNPQQPEDDMPLPSQWPESEWALVNEKLRYEYSGTADAERIASGKPKGRGDTTGDVMQQLNPNPGGEAPLGSMRNAVDHIYTEIDALNKKVDDLVKKLP